MTFNFKLSILIFIFCYGERGIEKDSFSFEAPKVYLSKEYHFNYVYEQVRKLEGFYVNHPHDRGRETYGGISRKNFPKWQGWQYIDAAKPLQRHDTVQQAEYWVKDWYLTRWVRGGFEIITDRELALNLFDFYIHSSPRTVELKVNRVLRKFGCDEVKVSGEWVIEDFNRVPPREFVLHLKLERLRLFNYLVRNDPTQIVFYKGWCKRVLEEI